MHCSCADLGGAAERQFNEKRATKDRAAKSIMSIQLDPEAHEIRALVALVPDLHHSRVIEVGCGDGRLTQRYAVRAASVLAFDPDETAIAALRSNRPPGNVELRTDTVDRVDIPEGSADVVLLSWAL